MGDSEDIILTKIRGTFEPFTAKSLRAALSREGNSFSLRAVEDAISSDPYVMELEDGRYITYAGAFTGKTFSATLTPEEITQGVFVAGDRCVPFGNPSILSDSFKFFAGGEEVPSKTGVFDSDTAIDMFMLYGEEYATQYIALDPANRDIDLIKNNYELSNEVKLTGIDLSFIMKKCKCTETDRLLLHVTDWENGEFEVSACEKYRGNPFKNEEQDMRIKWFNVLEKKFLEHFKKDGPMGSIAEQLTYIFYENSDVLCVPYCGSLKEFLFSYSKRVGFQVFGAETRLWKKGESVPFFGTWNAGLFGFNEDIRKVTSYENYVLSAISSCAYEQLIDNYFYITFSEERSFEDYIAAFFKDEGCAISGNKIKKISKDLRARFNYLFNEYNRFKDNELGGIRKDLVGLFTKVSSLVYRINYSGASAEKLPQQEMIILFQIYSHIMSLFEEFCFDAPPDKEFLEVLPVSVEGMKLSFSEISDALEAGLEDEMRRRFKLENGKEKAEQNTKKNRKKKE